MPMSTFDLDATVSARGDTLHQFVEHLRHCGDFKRQHHGPKDHIVAAEAFADLVAWWDSHSADVSQRDSEIGTVLREYAKGQAERYCAVLCGQDRRIRSWLRFGRVGMYVRGTSGFLCACCQAPSLSFAWQSGPWPASGDHQLLAYCQRTSCSLNCVSTLRCLSSASGH